MLMVVFLFSGPVLAQEKKEIPEGYRAISGLTVPEETWLGPVIKHLELGQNNTVGEAIDIICKSALIADRFFAFSVNVQEHELAAPYPRRLSQKHPSPCCPLLHK